MASLLVKASELQVGDILLLPFERQAVVKQVKPHGSKATFIHFKTEYGWTKLELTSEVLIHDFAKEIVENAQLENPRRRI